MTGLVEAFPPNDHAFEPEGIFILNELVPALEIPNTLDVEVTATEVCGIFTLKEFVPRLVTIAAPDCVIEVCG